MKIKLLAGITLGAALALSAIPAAAATLDWHVVYSGSGPLSTATLDFLTSDVLNALGGYSITGVSGNVGGDVITGLAPTNNPSSPPFLGTTLDGAYFADFDIYASPAHFSNYGPAFLGASGMDYNLFATQSPGPSNGPPNSPLQLLGYTPQTGYVGSAFTGNAVVTGGVPEPAAWAMMILGFGGIGATMRKKRAFAAA